MANDTDWGAVAIKLLRGPVYKNKEKIELWKKLTTYKKQLDDYFSYIGLRVFLDEEDGFAFLEQISDNLALGMEEENDEESETSTTQLPRLIKKAPLSYDVSMLCVLLRYELEKFENSQTESESLILRKNEIYSLYMSFTKEKADETKQIKDLDRALRTLCNLTFCSQKINLTKETSTTTWNLKSALLSRPKLTLTL